MSTKKLTTEEFIDRSKCIHGDKYSYDNTDYINSNTKVQIFCKNHSSYFTQKAGKHLMGQGCPECGKKITRKSTTEDFIEKAKKVHNKMYNYDKVVYVNNRTNVEIVCKHHGLFLQTPNCHLNGNGCQKCGLNKQTKSRSKTQEQFIEDAVKVHGDKYDYSLVEYVSSLVEVKILCKYHGEFQQTAITHTQNHGCPKCALLNRNGTYSRSEYIKKVDGKMCTFYTLRCFNEEEEFYKIGITKNTVGIRYKSKYNMPYEYEVISEVKGSAGFIWDLERDEKRKLKSLHYKPIITFGGSETECFTDYKI